jgi:hypothetical protein
MLTHSLCHPSGQLLFSDRRKFFHRGLKPTVRRIVLCCVMATRNSFTDTTTTTIIIVIITNQQQIQNLFAG